MIFDEKCINRGEEMDILHEDGSNMMGIEFIYWCPKCGTILVWYDSDKIENTDWKIPGLLGNLSSL